MPFLSVLHHDYPIILHKHDSASIAVHEKIGDYLIKLDKCGV